MLDTSRFIAFSSLALLLYSVSAAAECSKPAWPDPISLGASSVEAQVGAVYAFQSRAHEFIACQRGSLAERAQGLAPAAVQQLILRDRAAEDRAFAETESLVRCFSVSRREPDPEIARTKCESYIESALQERRQPESRSYTEVTSEQHSAYGGVWSHRTLDFGRPGRCMDAPCDNMLGVEVTNMTPVALRCEVALTASNRPEGARRGEQVVTLNPGDSVPAARVTIHAAPENIEAEAMCAPAVPLPKAPPVPAGCAVNWVPRSFDFPRGLARSAWESGTALLEIGVRKNHEPPDAIRIVHADSPMIGEAAQALIEKLSPSTSCTGQRFRIRVEYRAFPCYVCSLSPGVVTLY